MRSKGQAALEMVVALICVLILFAGAVKIYVWGNGRLVDRQQKYEGTRTKAGDSSPGVDVDSDLKLKIF